jgi:Lrp/AsnC ligand binding domain
VVVALAEVADHAVAAAAVGARLVAGALPDDAEAVGAVGVVQVQQRVVRAHQGRERRQVGWVAGHAVDPSMQTSRGSLAWRRSSSWSAWESWWGKRCRLAPDITGPYDVIVRAEARNIDELGKLVVARVQAVDGITRTLTCPVVHL